MLSLPETASENKCLKLTLAIALEIGRKDLEFLLWQTTEICSYS